jgi:hypothetical protein
MNRIPLRFLRASVAALALGCPTVSVQAAVVWPNLGPTGFCRFGLQACIDSLPAGDEVIIGSDDIVVADGYTEIDENIAITKSFTLRADDGVDAVFANDRIVQVLTPTTGTTTVRLDRLVFARGQVRLTHQSSDDSTLTLSRLHFRDVVAGDGSGTACAIRVVDNGSGVPTFNIGDNVLMLRRAQLRDGIGIRFNEGIAHANIFRNHIDSVDGGLRHAIYIGGNGGGSAAISANQIGGSGFDNGFVLARENTGGEPLQLRIDNNVVQGAARRGPNLQTAGIGVFASAEVDVQILHNTLAYGSNGIQVREVSPNTSMPTGRIANNVVAFNRESGIDLFSNGAPPPGNGFNLVHGNPFNFYTPGVGTVTTSPMFRSGRDLRPRDGSPAIAAGNNADIPAGELFDADGELRRIGTTDMGAYEFTGGRGGIHLTTPANIAGNVTGLHGVLRSTDHDELVFATPLRGAVPAPNLGVFFQTAWSVFNQDLTPMNADQRIAVSLPGQAGALHVHTAAASTITANATRTDHPELNSRSFAIATVTPVWNPPGQAGLYFDEQLELDYVSNRWWIAIPSVIQPMPEGRAFNMRIAPLLSPNAFTVTLFQAAIGSTIPLYHRLLDGRPCAAPSVTKSREPHNTPNVYPFALEYRPADAERDGHWYIVPDTNTATNFPLLSSFNVIVDGAVSDACAGEILMEDSFE